MKIGRESTFLVLGLLCVLSWAAPRTLAQATISSALLRGTVQDSSQAAVPRATVTITNEATNVSEKTLTDEQGRYVFGKLQPASYTVKVEVAGFKTAVQSNVVLRVGQQSDLDFTLEVGELTTTVEITAAAPLLNSVSAALGAEVDNRYITEVPLFDRQITNLAFLAPGVTQTANDSFGGNGQTGYAGTNFSSNGQKSSTAEVRWDGLSSSPPDGTGSGNQFFYAQIQPSPEFVQEFKVETNSFSAEYGTNGGTVLNIVSKSGSNSFHGSGYYWARRPRWDANGFFANREGQEKKKYKRDNFGGSIGGPIIKNRTFFFFDYDQVIFNEPGTITTSVPTLLERKGDFSQSFNPDGSLRQIYNPFLIDAVTGDRPAFSGNIIPSSLFDSIGAKVANFYPEPTSEGDPFTHANNYVKNYTSNSPRRKWDVKIDHLFSEKHRISGRYSRAFWSSEPPDAYGGNNPADPNAVNSDYVQHNGVLEYTWSLNPNTIWSNRVGVSRYVRDSLPIEFDATSLGFPSYLQAAGGGKVFPLFLVGSYGSYAQLGTWFGVWVEHNTLPSWSSSVSKVWGAHTSKFGYEQRLFFGNYWAPGAPNGTFMFDSNGLSATEQNYLGFNPNQGHGVASMLLGWGDPYSWGTLDVQPASATRSQDTSFYFQDDWRVTSKLTLNLGLRYEWQTPYSERYDRIQVGDPDFDTGITVPGLGGLHGAVLPGTAENRHISRDSNNFAPRVGFAYRLGNNSVIRGGAGIYYGLSQLQGEWLPSTIFRKAANWTTTYDNGLTRFATLADPYPTRSFEPQGRKYGNLAGWGFGNSSVQFGPARNPEIYQWNVSFQHQLTSTLLLEVAYNSNRSTHQPEPGTSNFNLPFKEARNFTVAQLSEQVPNPFFSLFCGSFDEAAGVCVAPGSHFFEPDSGYSRPTIARSTLLTPHPQFGGMSAKNWPGRGSSEYNSLMFRFEKRYSHGLNFVGHYTFSQYYSDTGSYITWLGNSVDVQDPYDLRKEWSVDGADTPHRFVFGYSYELPVGRGRALGNNMNKVLDKIVGGWQLNGVVNLQTGNPLNLYSYNTVTGGTQRPNIRDNPRSQFSVQDVVDRKGNYFNVNLSALECSDPGAGAICAPPEQQNGNGPRFYDNLRQPWYHSWDMSVFKNFKIQEGSELQLRAEFFNFTNTPVFRIGHGYYTSQFDQTVLGKPTFGTINSVRVDARQFQLGIRYTF
jgi:hypothetical protein